MNTKPILFSTPMVQAIMAERKTKTRRTKGLECVNDEPDFYTWCNEVYQLDIPRKAIRYDEKYYYEFTGKHNNSTSVVTTCPYGKVGDVLWVRETFQYMSEPICKYFFKADNNDKLLLSFGQLVEDTKWKPSIFMPKIACRIFLEITNVRVERLQDISQEDAKSEGVYPAPHRYPGWSNPLNQYQDCFKCSFKRLWQKINGPQSWEANPFVWVIEFKQITKPKNFI